jgi:hypothetical protein
MRRATIWDYAWVESSRRKETLMKPVIRLLFSCTLLLIYASSIFAQESVRPRKFKTTYKIDMFVEADFHSKKIGSIPDSVVPEALEETERYGGYIRVTYKNKTGWVLKAETERYMDVPAPELACWSNGYKIIGSIYRYFFVLRNDGTLPYVGNITIRLFNRDGKTVFEKTVDFSDGINPNTGGQFPIDTTVETPRFELEHKGGKIKGDTVKLIERL